MSRNSTYSCHLTLEAGLAETFDLLSDPRALNGLTPTWFQLRPYEPVPTPLQVGSKISYRLRWRGLPLRWTSRMTEWRSPVLLTYEQERGPYAFFRHEHRFEAVGDATRVIDRVDYRSGFGSWLDRTLVQADLERIFEHRARRARALLE
ncbi:MAG: SRPBCC family protein [Acidimicrobiia bacterium]|nr:SRPBCC family protein [Acidimicrobiia bacterium]